MRTLERFVSYNLGSLPDVRAIFFSKKENNYNIYTVVKEFSEHIFSLVLDEEQLIIDNFPEYQFDFRLCASQGRELSEAVPMWTNVLLRKD